MFWIFIVVIIVVIIAIAINGSSKEKAIREKYLESGLDLNELKSLGSYAGGHPDKNENVDNCFCLRKDGEILFFQKMIGVDTVQQFSIGVEQIKGIEVEDSSSLENKVTLGRVLLVGVFALAWRKKKKNELAFVTIDWNDGRFYHSTVFSFEGKDAMMKANTARNNLIKMCR